MLAKTVSHSYRNFKKLATQHGQPTLICIELAIFASKCVKWGGLTAALGATPRLLIADDQLEVGEALRLICNRTDINSHHHCAS